MSAKPNCPNCVGLVGHEENGCVLATLFGVVRDRGETSERKIRKLWKNANSDAIWSALGPIVDSLEDGEYNV